MHAQTHILARSRDLSAGGGAEAEFQAMAERSVQARRTVSKTWRSLLSPARVRERERERERETRADTRHTEIHSHTQLGARHAGKQTNTRAHTKAHIHKYIHGYRNRLNQGHRPRHKRARIKT